METLRCIDTMTKDEISDELGNIADALSNFIPEGQNPTIDRMLERLWEIAARVTPTEG